MTERVPEAMAQGVDNREGHRCLKCGRHMIDPPVGGFSRHHRMRRRDGGNSYENLVLVCGSGSTGCHGELHSKPRQAISLGLILPANFAPPLDPAIFPVRTHTGHWKMLDPGGFYGETVPESLAAELFNAFGVWRGYMPVGGDAA